MRSVSEPRSGLTMPSITTRRRSWAGSGGGGGSVRGKGGVGGGGVRSGPRVKRVRLPGVRDDKGGPEGRPRAAGPSALHPPVNADVLELTTDLHDAAPDHAAIGFELSLAGSSGADAAAETLEVSPLPDQTRE